MTDKHQKQHERKARQAVAKAQTNRDKARRKLLRQREKLARRRTRNRHQSETRRDDNEEETKNPTAHSTLPPQKSNAETAARNSHSTVPKAPKYTEVPARERLYGLGLHRKTSERKDEASATSHVSKNDTGEEKTSTDE